MKTCSKCNQSKPLDEFNKSSRTKDGRHNYCRECQKQHYRNNVNRHMANVKANKMRYRQAARLVVVEAMAGGCVDCGNTDIRVLEFDHLRDKTGGVMSIARDGSLDRLRAEIDKCVVRCRNCHAIKTYERLGGSWHNAFVTE